jgi:hypothetical protein
MWTINSLLATAALRSSRHSIANLSVLTLDQPVTSSVSISIASDRLRFTCRNNTDLVDCLERVALTAAKHLLRFRPISASPSRQNLPIESSTLDERVDDNTISLSHVPSADNIDDLLTNRAFARLPDLLALKIGSSGSVRIRRSRVSATWQITVLGVL